MAFSIYDPKGFRRPYHPEDQWRPISPADEALPYLETKKQPKQSPPADDLRKVKDTPAWVPKHMGREQTIVASQIMKSPVISLSPETSLEEAWKLFTAHRFRHVPVINSEGNLVGILSDRGLLKAISPFNEVPQDHKKRIVSDIMVTDVLTAHPNTDIAAIAKVFIEKRIGAMPIVTGEGAIVGMLTRSDILRTIVKIDLTEFRA